MVTRALGPDDVDVFRSLRLAALNTDPAAFRSNLERELAFPAGAGLDDAA